MRASARTRENSIAAIYDRRHRRYGGRIPSAKLAELFGRFDVAPGPDGDVFLLVGGELPANFRRRSEYERAGRNFHSYRDQRVCADDGTRAHLDIVENDRAHADEHFIVDLARVHDGIVSDGDQFAYDCRIVRIDVSNSIVLNIGARPDDDAVDVAPQDGAVPHARFFFENHIAQQRGARNNPCAGMDRRTFFQTCCDAGVPGGERIWLDVHFGSDVECSTSVLQRANSSIAERGARDVATSDASSSSTKGPLYTERKMCLIPRIGMTTQLGRLFSS